MLFIGKFRVLFKCVCLIDLSNNDTNINIKYLIYPALVTEDLPQQHGFGKKIQVFMAGAWR